MISYLSGFLLFDSTRSNDLFYSLSLIASVRFNSYRNRTVNFCRRFSKLFGKCLPSRKGKGNEDTAIDSHGENLKTRTLIERDEKKDDNQPPNDCDCCEKEGEETYKTTEELDQNTSEDSIFKPKMESEEGEVHEGRESVSFSQQEALKTEEGSPNKTKENKEAEQIVDPREEDYKWEVSCCGVDLPMSQ